MLWPCKCTFKTLTALVHVLQLHRRYDVRPPQLHYARPSSAGPPGQGAPTSAPGTPVGWVGPEGADAWFEFLHGPGGPGRVRGASEVSLAGSDLDAREAEAASVRSNGWWWDKGAAVRPVWGICRVSGMPLRWCWPAVQYCVSTV